MDAKASHCFLSSICALSWWNKICFLRFSVISFFQSSDEFFFQDYVANTLPADCWVSSFYNFCGAFTTLRPFRFWCKMVGLYVPIASNISHNHHFVVRLNSLEICSVLFSINCTKVVIALKVNSCESYKSVPSPNTHHRSHDSATYNQKIVENDYPVRCSINDNSTFLNIMTTTTLFSRCSTRHIDRSVVAINELWHSVCKYSIFFENEYDVLREAWNVMILKRRPQL